MKSRNLFYALLACGLAGAMACSDSDDDGNGGEGGADAAEDTATGDAGETDAGETDAGETDTGETDAGETDTGETDTGETDTGETDTGETDTGETDTGETDTGETDTGETDTGETDTGETDTGETDTGMDTGMDAGPSADRVLFDDDWIGLSYAAFGGSVGAPVIDEVEFFEGSASMRIDIPGEGYTGGALVPEAPEDVSGYNAITFWARTNNSAALFDKVGVGNDSASDALQIERPNLQFTDEWQFFVMPLGAPDELTDLAGLFHWAEGSEGAYSVWMDNIRYTTLDNLDAPSPAIATLEENLEVGQTTNVVGQVVNVWYRGEEGPDDDELIGIQAQPIFFSYDSSNEDVATVDDLGVVTARGEGTAVISAMFGGVGAAGMLTLNVGEAVEVGAPEGPAPVPTTPTEDVVEVIFSDAPGYERTFIETFLTPWSESTTFMETSFAEGDFVLQYGSFGNVGINFEGDNSIDITAATHVRFDIWTPNAAWFEIKLVDFGPNNGFLGEPNDDSEGFVQLGEGRERALPQGEWVSVDLPLSAFEAAGLNARANLSQLVLTARGAGEALGVAAVYLDNIYFYTAAE